MNEPVREQEYERQPKSLYDIVPHPVNESVNTLKWMAEHPGVKTIFFEGQNGEQKNFLFEKANKVRYRHSQSRLKLPDSIIPMFDTHLHIPVIAKKGYKSWGSNSEWTNSAQEAHLAGVDTHPYIARIYSLAADSEGEVYTIMEYLPGGTLGNWMEKPHTAKELLNMFGKISSALEHLHKERKILFLDTKPQNIGIDKNGDPKLIDFGIASRLNQDGFAVNKGGTPSYESPEQTGHDLVTTRADVYGLAATVLAVFSSINTIDFSFNIVDFESGRYGMPFREEYQKMLTSDQKTKLAEVIRRGMNKDPDKRQTSITEFYKEFEAALIPTTS